MKRSIISRRFTSLLTAMFFVLLTSAAFAKTDAVNSKIMSHFTNSFAKAESVTWKVTKQFSKATCINNNKRTEVFYNRKGRYIGTAVYVTMKELPAGTANTLADEYPAYRPATAVQYTDVEEQMSYYVEMENDKKKFLLQIDPQGEVTYVKSLSK